MSTVEVPSLLFHSPNDFLHSTLLSFPSSPLSPVSFGSSDEMHGRLPLPSQQQRDNEQAAAAAAAAGQQPQQPPLHPYLPSYAASSQSFGRPPSSSSFPYMPSGTSPSFPLPSYSDYPSPPLHAVSGDNDVDAPFDDSMPIPMLSDSELPPMSPTPPPLETESYGSGGEMFASSRHTSTTVYATAHQAYTITSSSQQHTHSAAGAYAPTSPPLHPYRSGSPQYGSVVKAEYSGGPLSPTARSTRTYYPPQQPYVGRSSSSTTSPRHATQHFHPHSPPLSHTPVHYATASSASATARPYNGGHSPTVASAYPAVYPPPSPPTHLLNILSATLQVNARNALPSEEILMEAARQLGTAVVGSGNSSSVPSPASSSGTSPLSSSASTSPSHLSSPRQLSPSASPLPSGAAAVGSGSERRLIRMDIQSLTSLLLAVAATATGGRGGLIVSHSAQQRHTEPAGVHPSSSTAVSASGHLLPSSPSSSLYLATHRASLPSLLPSTYSPHQVHERDMSQFERHSSRSRSKSRRRQRSHTRRNRSATPAQKEDEYEAAEDGEAMGGEPKVEAGHADMSVLSSAMSVTEEVADQFGSLSFDENESELQRPTTADAVRSSARRRSVSQRQGARDRSRSLSTKRKRDGDEGSFGQTAGHDEQAEEEGYSSLSSYDSDDDSVDELDTAAIASQLPVNPSAAVSAASAAQSGNDPLSPPSTSGQPKRRPGRPAKAGGPNRPRPRTQYSPLTDEQKEERSRVRQYLTAESLTQSDLARVCGVSKASMCTWLQGATSRAMHQRIWARVVDWMAEVDRGESGSVAGVLRGRSVASSSSSGGGSSSSSCSSTASG